MAYFKKSDLFDMEALNTAYKRLAAIHLPELGGDAEIMAQIKREYILARKKMRPEYKLIQKKRKYIAEAIKRLEAMNFYADADADAD